MPTTQIPAHVSASRVFPFDCRTDDVLRHDPWFYCHGLSPERALYRKLLVNELFSPRALAALDEQSRRETRELFSGFQRGECEFVADFAYRLPAGPGRLRRGAKEMPEIQS